MQSLRVGGRESLARIVGTLRHRIPLVEEKVDLSQFRLMLRRASSLKDLVDAAVAVLRSVLLLVVPTSKDPFVFYW